MLLLAAVAGCYDSSTGPTGIAAEDVEKIRTQFLVSEEPAGAKSVIEVRDQLAPSPAEPGDRPAGAATKVVVVGVLGGGMPNPFGSQDASEFPWFPQMAAFALVDPTTAQKFANTDHQHAEGQECIFCTNSAQELVDTVAVVSLEDDSGTILPHRADALLGLTEGATVVVEGRGRVELGQLKVVAERIFVRH